MDFKQRFKEKSYGFYVTLAVAVLCIVTAIVYAACYSKIARFMSWPAFALLIAAPIIALALAYFRLDEIGTAVMALFGLISLLLFVYVIYNYVVVVMVGIDLSSFDGEFITSTVMFAITFVASVVNLFLPQKKLKEAAV